MTREGAAFKKTVGLNGVGVKAVNYLSSTFRARSVRGGGEAHTVYFEQGLEQSDRWESGVDERDGTEISFRVDEAVFGSYSYNMEYVEQLVRNYTYLNRGLTIRLNGQSYASKNGLLDLLNENMTEEPLYPPIHLMGEDIELVISPRLGLRRELLFVRQRPVYDAGRHASDRLPRSDCQDGQGVLP